MTATATATFTTYLLGWGRIQIDTDDAGYATARVLSDRLAAALARQQSDARSLARARFLRERIESLAADAVHVEILDPDGVLVG